MGEEAQREEESQLSEDAWEAETWDAWVQGHLRKQHRCSSSTCKLVFSDQPLGIL